MHEYGSTHPLRDVSPFVGRARHTCVEPLRSGTPTRLSGLSDPYSSLPTGSVTRAPRQAGRQHDARLPSTWKPPARFMVAPAPLLTRSPRTDVSPRCACANAWLELAIRSHSSRRELTCHSKRPNACGNAPPKRAQTIPYAATSSPRSVISARCSSVHSTDPR